MGKNTGKTVEKKWKPWKDESNIWGSGNTKRRGACRLPAFVASDFFVHRKRFMFSSKSNEESKSFCPKRLGHLVGFERLVDSWFQVFFEELNPNRWSHDWDSAISPDIGKTLIFGYRTRYSISFDGDKICVKCKALGMLYKTGWAAPISLEYVHHAYRAAQPTQIKSKEQTSYDKLLVKKSTPYGVISQPP